MKLVVSDASSVACASPVRTCVPGGRIFWISAVSCSGVTPGFAFARIWSSLPTLVEERLRRRQVEAGERRAAEARRAAELDEPGDLHLPHRPVRPRRRSSGRPRGPSCRAVVLSTTSSSAPGHLPSTSVSVLNCGPRRVDAEAEVRRAAERDHLAVRARRGSRCRRRRRRRRRRRAGRAPRSSSDSSNGGAVVLDWSREVERGLAGDGRVGAAVDLAEDRRRRRP